MASQRRKSPADAASSPLPSGLQIRSILARLATGTPAPSPSAGSSFTVSTASSTVYSFSSSFLSPTDSISSVLSPTASRLSVPSNPASSSPYILSPTTPILLLQQPQQAEQLHQHLQTDTSGLTTDVLRSKNTDLCRLRTLLLDNDDQTRAKDVFRDADGFQTLLRLVRSASGFYNFDAITSDLRTQLVELLKTVLEVLSDAMADYWKNRQFFDVHVEEGGWSALAQAIAGTGIASVSVGDDLYVPALAQLFGLLVGFALNESHLTRIMSDLSASSPSTESRDDNFVLSVTRILERRLNGQEVVRNPEGLVIMFNFWKHTLLQQKDSESDYSSLEARCLSMAVLKTIHILAAQSTRNAVGIHRTGILSALLPLVIGNDTEQVTDHFEATALRDLTHLLLRFGIDTIENAYFMFDQTSESLEKAKFLLAGIHESREPPFIQFDSSSSRDYCAVEFSDIGSSFPPPPSSPGYSVVAWIRVDKFDPVAHTTIFGIYDQSQTLFVLLYIDKDNRNLVFQTSTRAPRQSVRFRSTSFEPSRWYHIAIVHTGKGTTQAGQEYGNAYLYVDGNLAERAKSVYPSSAPPRRRSSSSAFGTLTSSLGIQSNEPAVPVQAFVGTSQAVSSRWSVASFHLFGDALSDELLGVLAKLGPRYYGNFQDSLGSFQTYRTSAELITHHELLHPGAGEKSDIMAAFRQKAGSTLPESKIILSVLPTTVMGPCLSSFPEEGVIVQGLSDRSRSRLRTYLNGKGQSILVNAAIPSINDALEDKNSVGVLTGNPVVGVPFSLDDAVLSVGGVAALGLKFIEKAQTDEQVITAVHILCALVEYNWRNSETMESEKGFSVLASVLREKLGLSATEVSDRSIPPSKYQLAKDLFGILATFVGHDGIQSDRSVIINALGYRSLFIEWDTWRRGPAEVQRLYYQQFVHFVDGARFRHFNVKRVVRMRVLRRLLDALKSEVFFIGVFPELMYALKILARCGFNRDTVRMLTTFVTFAVGNREGRARDNNKNRVLDSSRDDDAELGRRLTLRELGRAVFGLLADMVCEPSGIILRKPVSILGPLSSTTKALLSVVDCSGDDKDIENEAGVGDDDSPPSKEISDLIPSVTLTSIRIITRLVLSLRKEDTGKKIIIDKPSPQLSSFSSSGSVTSTLQPSSTASSQTQVQVDNDCVIRVILSQVGQCIHMTAAWMSVFSVLFGTEVDIYLQKSETKDLHLGESLDQMFSMADVVVVRPEAIPVLMGMIRQAIDIAISENKSSEKSHMQRTVKEVIEFLVTKSTGIAFKDPTVAMLYRTELMNVPTIGTSDFDDRISVDSTTVDDMRRDLQSYSGDEVEGDGINLDDSDIITDSETIKPEPRFSARRSSLVVVPTFEEEAGTKPCAITIPSPGLCMSMVMSRSSLAQSPSHGQDSSRFGLPAPPTDIPETKLHPLVSQVLELLADLTIAPIFRQEDFPGLGLSTIIPRGGETETVALVGLIVGRIVNRLEIRLKEPDGLDTVFLHARAVNAACKCVIQLAETILEGAVPASQIRKLGTDVLDLAGMISEYSEASQRDDMDNRRIKVLEMCRVGLANVKSIFRRLTLILLSDNADDRAGVENRPWIRGLEKNNGSTAFMTDEAVIHRISFWLAVGTPGESDPRGKVDDFTRFLNYLLFSKLISGSPKVSSVVIDSLRLQRVHQPDLIVRIFSNLDRRTGNRRMIDEIGVMLEENNDAFLEWVRERSTAFAILFSVIKHSWEGYASVETRRLAVGATKRAGRLIEAEEQRDKFLRVEGVAKIAMESDVSSWRQSTRGAENRRRRRVWRDMLDTLSSIAGLRSRLSGQTLDGDDRVECWRLDETEGRDRMRLKLIPELRGRYRTLTQGSAKKQAQALESDDDYVDGGEGDSGSEGPDGMERDRDDDFLMVDDPEDRLKRVLRSLDDGDRVEAAFNVARIDGLAALEGLLIIGRTGLYILDGLFRRADNEVVTIEQAPIDERDPFVRGNSDETSALSSSLSSDTPDGTRRWVWASVLSLSLRRYLLRDVALEAFFTDGRSVLLTTASTEQRDSLFSKMASRAPRPDDPDAARRRDAVREAGPSFGARVAGAFGGPASGPVTQKWVRGEMSNFAYLMWVNTVAGRSFNDLTQYPVFPWVLSAYKSRDLDLESPASFRDLEKPMGAQDPERAAKFRERYEELEELELSTIQEQGQSSSNSKDRASSTVFSDTGLPPFHYGTHYSSAMVVSAFLVRLEPFAYANVLLQGGTFDHPDRLFNSIEEAWNGAAHGAMTDVRELTPEFFCLPDFLSNVNRYDFGRTQASKAVSDVQLPAWAREDPVLFVRKHRAALESKFVSQNLHKWIDLIFGAKQRGQAAINAQNVFHHLSYGGAVDLETLSDPFRRRAAIATIHNFGQTPAQLFSKSHPQRTCYDRAPANRSLDGDDGVELLTCKGSSPIIQITDRVTSLLWVERIGKPVCSTPRRVTVAPSHELVAEWGWADAGIRFFATEAEAGDPVSRKKRKLLGLTEHLHPGPIAHALCAGSTTLVTAGADSAVAIWTVTGTFASGGVSASTGLSSTSEPVGLRMKALLRGHRAKVTALASCPALAMLVSCAADGSVLVWDLNRLLLIRELQLPRTCVAAQTVTVNGVSGDIIVGCGGRVVVWTVNGRGLADVDVSSEIQDRVRMGGGSIGGSGSAAGIDEMVGCVAVYDGVGGGPEYVQRDLIFTGHGAGVVGVWELVPKNDTSGKTTSTNRGNTNSSSTLPPPDLDPLAFSWTLRHVRTLIQPQCRVRSSVSATIRHMSSSRSQQQNNPMSRAPAHHRARNRAQTQSPTSFYQAEQRGSHHVRLGSNPSASTSTSTNDVASGGGSSINPFTTRPGASRSVSQASGLSLGARLGELMMGTSKSMDAGSGNTRNEHSSGGDYDEDEDEDEGDITDVNLSENTITIEDEDGDTNLNGNVVPAHTRTSISSGTSSFGLANLALPSFSAFAGGIGGRVGASSSANGSASTSGGGFLGLGGSGGSSGLDDRNKDGSGGSSSGGNDFLDGKAARITALLPVRTGLFVADERGRVWEWEIRR